MSLAKKLVAPQLRDLQPYQSARRIGGIGQVYLNANESAFAPYEMPVTETWNRYPDFLPTDLTLTYSRYAGINPDRTMAVRGADEAIDLLIRTFCEPYKDAIRIQSPTYSMYEFVAQAHGVAVDNVPLGSSFELDEERNCSDKVDSNNLKIVFICNPNNPTGNALSHDSIAAVAEAHRNSAFVVVDEAYIEYCPQESSLSLIDSHPNVIVIRTLSKAFALAAIRVGFLIAREEVLEQVGKLLAPYPMPDDSARIAINALSEPGVSHMQSCRDQTIALREQMHNDMRKLKIVEQVYSSATNFLLVRFRDASLVMQTLLEDGVVIRDQTHFAQLPQHLRITAGTSEEILEMMSHIRAL
jgi:histidinol-phosphate aminotransferase